MGQSSSTTGGGANINLNRIRATCQKDSNMPLELQQFNIELLANDMNKLGYDIAIRDARGKPHSSDDICRRIHEATPPSVEAVCMRGPKSGTDTLRNLVKHFNKYYGANIFMKKDPRNPRSGDRSVSEVCDDLYLTADRVHRGLKSDTVNIKKNLEESIASLTIKKNEMDSVFSQQLSNLHRGADYDRVSGDISELNALQHGMVGKLNNNLDQLKNIYNTVDHNIGIKLAETEKVYAKKMGNYAGLRMPPGMSGLSGLLSGGPGAMMHNGSSGMMMRGGDGPLDVSQEDLKKIMAIGHMVPALAVMSNQCVDCLKEFYGDHEHPTYMELRENPAELHADLTFRLDSKLQALHDKGAIDPAAYKKLVKCYQNLMHNNDQCKSSIESAKTSFSGDYKPISAPASGEFNGRFNGGGYGQMSAGAALSELLS
jgi:hypothetical protein